MVQLISFRHSNRKNAFMAGFWKGLGSPVLLASTFALDKDAVNYEFKPLPARKKSGISEDWKRVGADIRSAIDIG